MLNKVNLLQVFRSVTFTLTYIFIYKIKSYTKMDHKATIQELKRMIGLDTSNRNASTANTATSNNQVNQGKKGGGFQGKHHDLSTKAKISQTQKQRYQYMRQMMKQQQQQNEQTQHFGPIFDLNNPEVTQRIKDIVRELLHEEIKNAIPSRKTMQNIPIF